MVAIQHFSISGLLIGSCRVYWNVAALGPQATEALDTDAKSEHPAEDGIAS
jgi:hypothetical protein